MPARLHWRSVQPKVWRKANGQNFLVPTDVPAEAHPPCMHVCGCTCYCSRCSTKYTRAARACDERGLHARAHLATQHLVMGCGASQPSKPASHPLKHGLSNFETFGQPQPTRTQPVQPVAPQLVVQRSALVDEKARSLEEKLLKQEERRSRNSSSTYRASATERSEESASGTPGQQKMSRGREVRRAKSIAKLCCATCIDSRSTCDL